MTVSRPRGPICALRAFPSAKLLVRCLLFLALSPLLALQAKALPFFCRQSFESPWQASYEFMIVHPESIEIALPTGDRGFEPHRVNSWEDVQKLLGSLPPDLLQQYRHILEHAKDQFTSVARQVRALGKKYHGSAQIRIKANKSLYAKVVQKAFSYQLNNKLFTIDDLSDLVAGRLILPLNSPLLQRTESKEAWAQALTVPIQDLLKVELKGAAPHENPYRAIHIDLRGERGIPYEVQFMSRLTALWHSWDHATVHKPLKSTGSEELSRLRQYSHRWMRLIRQIEDTISSGDPGQVRRLLDHLQIKDPSSTDWMRTMDSQFLAEFSIPPKHSILTMGYRRRPGEPNRRLIKELTETLSPTAAERQPES